VACKTKSATSLSVWLLQPKKVYLKKPMDVKMEAIESEPAGAQATVAA